MKRVHFCSFLLKSNGSYLIFMLIYALDIGKELLYEKIGNIFSSFHSIIYFIYEFSF